MSKHGIVYGKGVNDMPRGWTKVDEWNYRVYILWQSMIRRCYDEKYHETHPCYNGCTVCERWLTLSNFVEDVTKIDDYELWLNHPKQRISLDKDIKSNGQNKYYCLEQCRFVDFGENSRQAHATRDNTYLKERTGEKAPNRGELVAQIDKDTKQIINLKYNREYERLGFTSSSISHCCKGEHKTHKGFIFRYLSDVPDDVINSYIIRTKQIPIK